MRGEEDGAPRRSTCCTTGRCGGYDFLAVSGQAVALEIVAPE